MAGVGGIGRIGRVGLLSLAAAGFSPANVSSLLAHHDPSDASSVTLNGSDVASVADKSGNSRAAAQATGAQQPAYTTANINSKNVVTFTGANNDALAFANSLSLARNKPGITFVGVVKITDFSASNRLFSILCGSGVGLFTPQVNTGRTLNLASRRVGADSVSGLSSTATLTSGVASFVAYTVDYATGTVVLQIDGTTRTQTASWAAGAASEDVNHFSAPNYGRNSTNLFTGIMGETAIYGRALTIAELDALRTQYFKPKYGLS